MKAADPVRTTLADLERELLDRPEGGPEAPIPEDRRFEIRTEQEAAWVVGKMVALDHREAVLKEQYKAMQKDIANDRAYLLWRLGGELAGWASKNLPRGKKSIKLLTGTVGFRSMPDRIEVTDYGKLIQWAQKHIPDAVTERTEYDVDMSAVKAAIKDGKTPDGVVVTPQEDKFFVKG